MKSLFPCQGVSVVGSTAAIVGGAAAVSVIPQSRGASAGMAARCCRLYGQSGVAGFSQSLFPRRAIDRVFLQAVRLSCGVYKREHMQAFFRGADNDIHAPYTALNQGFSNF